MWYVQKVWALLHVSRIAMAIAVSDHDTTAYTSQEAHTISDGCYKEHAVFDSEIYYEQFMFL